MQPAENAPIERIFNTIWVYAVADGARAIRIRPALKGTEICYQIGDEWRSQMKIPAYVHRPLLQQIDKMRRGDHLNFRLRDENFNVGLNWRLRVEKVSTKYGEEVILHFEKPQFPQYLAGDTDDDTISG